jgi:hypothetical protein
MQNDERPMIPLQGSYTREMLQRAVRAMMSRFRLMPSTVGGPLSTLPGSLDALASPPNAEIARFSPFGVSPNAFGGPLNALPDSLDALGSPSNVEIARFLRSAPRRTRSAAR